MIQHHLQKDLSLPCCRVAMKPLLTEDMKKKWVAFAEKCQDGTPEQWKKVTWSDNITFQLAVRSDSKVVWRPSDVSRDMTTATQWRPWSILIVSWFGDVLVGRRAGVVSISSLRTPPWRGKNYIEILEEYLLTFYNIHNDNCFLMIFYNIHNCDFFMHDGTPAYKSQAVKDFLNEHNIEVLDWPGN